MIIRPSTIGGAASVIDMAQVGSLKDSGGVGTDNDFEAGYIGGVVSIGALKFARTLTPAWVIALLHMRDLQVDINIVSGASDNVFFEFYWVMEDFDLNTLTYADFAALSKVNPTNAQYYAEDPGGRATYDGDQGILAAVSDAGPAYGIMIEPTNYTNKTAEMITLYAGAPTSFARLVHIADV